MNVFFYGLFMDREVLIKNDIYPSNPKTGYLDNYTLKIGNRASLIPCENEKAYGIVLEVNEEELTKLYAEHGVKDYVPEYVEIVTESNKKINALCYNLPINLLTGSNESYAKSLYKLAKQLSFPEEYLKKIIKNPH